MVAYIEKKMQAELGAEAGKLVFVYDLPKERCKDISEYEVDQVLEELNRTPPVRVEIGAAGTVPAEALEEIDEEIEVPKVVTVKEKKLDYKSRRFVQIERKKTIGEKVKTGKKTTRLKAGWSVNEAGDLFRKPTVEDLDLDAIAKKHPALPQWVLDRVKGGKQAKQSLSSLVEDIKKKMQASASKSPDKQTLASNTQIQ